jgi:hypothetical protein
MFNDEEFQGVWVRRESARYKNVDVPITPTTSVFAHPVLTDNGFGQCNIEIDPATGRSERCPHGILVYWE